MVLSDLRVLDLTRLLPGPFCTLMLADMGADVIKVEDPAQGDYLRWWPPLRDGQSAMFSALNRNKRSVILDLKAAAGRDALLRLAATADVVVESFRPGVMDRLGVGYYQLAAVNPGIVLCSISGYGQDGPEREKAGHDLNYIGLAGALDPEAARLPSVQIGDLGGGAANAVVAILAALHERRTSGRGQHCDIAMRDGVLAWQTGNAARVLATDDGDEGDILSGEHPCYGVYRCADGHLTVAALEPKFWTELTSVLDIPHLADEAFAKGDAAARVRTEIEAILVRHTRAQWMDRLKGHDVCVEPVLTLAEVMADPQTGERGMLIDHGTTGDIDQVGFPIRFSRTPAQWRHAAPGHGEQGRQILSEAGYDDAEIDALINEGITR